MMNFRTFAILPAGGCGQRTGLDLPKQYCDVLGRPLIVYILECLQRITWIEKVILAIASDRKEYVDELIQRYQLTKVELVKGSTSRHRSIQNGVKHLRDCILKRRDDVQYGEENEKLPDEEEPLVIVHDAVRPFADEDIFRRVTLAAREHKAAGSVLPLVSTILESDQQDVLIQSLVRSKFKESHTPQAFTWSTLETAYEKISEHDLDHGTEVLDLALKHTGCRAKLVEVPDYVWKVTYKKDFIAAESFAKAHSSEVFLLSNGPQTGKTLGILLDLLTSRNLKVEIVSTLPDVIPPMHLSIVLHLVNPLQEEVTMKCEQNLDLLVSKSACGGLLACLCHVSDDDDSTLGFYRRLARRLASQGETESVCVFIIAYTSTQKHDTVSRTCEMAASLIYDRNHLMSGQLFIMSVKD